MGLCTIVTLLACIALSSSEPFRFGNLFGGFGNIGDIDIGIIDPQTLLSQLIQQKGYVMTSVEIQSEQLKQVNSKLQAQMKFTALSNGNVVECYAQIFAYVVGRNAQILPQSSLNCSPGGGALNYPGSYPGGRSAAKTKRNSKLAKHN